MSYTIVPTGASLDVKQFDLSIAEEQIKDFKQLLQLSRVGPETYENLQQDRSLGLDRQWFVEAKKYWEDKYDWRKTEDRIKSFPNFKSSIKDDDGDTYDIHFVALFSQKKTAVPIVLLHGWPGSFLEFLGVLDLLKAKYTSANLPYHVIVPSLPGYAFSSGPSRKRDWVCEDMARIMNKLMVGLGFGGGYVAQGGDLGAFVARILAAQYEECKAVHLNFDVMPQPDGVSTEDISEAEMKGLGRAQDFGTLGDAYGREHGQRPATIGLVLSSSPLSLLAWISEKFLTWTDQDPSLDQILDSVTLYWLTDCFPTSIYPYSQFYGENAESIPVKHYVEKPLGYSWFPMEIAPMPKAWVAKRGNLVWHREHKDGGHFAAMEKPDELVQDIEDFVAQVWKGES